VARSAISARAENVLRAVAGLFLAPSIGWLISLTGITVGHLSRTAAERAPAVRVEDWACRCRDVAGLYDLYGSALREQARLLTEQESAHAAW